MPRSFRRRASFRGRRSFRRRGRGRFARGRSRGRFRRRGRRGSHKFAGIRHLSLPAPKQQVLLRYVGNTANVLYKAVIAAGSSTGHAHFGTDLHNLVKKAWGTVYASATVIPSKNEWFDWYNRWRVNMVDCVATINNEYSTRVWNVGWYINDVNDTFGDTTASWDEVNVASRSQTQWTRKTCTVAGGSKPKVSVRMRIPIARKTGNKAYSTDEDFIGGIAGTPGTSPSKGYNFFFYIWNDNGAAEASEITVPLDLRINLYCTMLARGVEID